VESSNEDSQPNFNISFTNFTHLDLDYFDKNVNTTTVHKSGSREEQTDDLGSLEEYYLDWDLNDLHT